jgi:hypothetical protein
MQKLLELLQWQESIIRCWMCLPVKRAGSRSIFHRLHMHVAADLPIDSVQANVDPRKPFEEWELEKLANKMRQYCPLLEDMSGATLEQVTALPNVVKRFAALTSCLQQTSLLHDIRQAKGTSSDHFRTSSILSLDC